MTETRKSRKGDLVTYLAKGSDAVHYPYGVNIRMEERLLEKVFRVKNQEYDDCRGTQRLWIDICDETKNPEECGDLEGWKFSAPMFSLYKAYASPYEGLPLLSFDDMCGGGDEKTV